MITSSSLPSIPKPDFRDFYKHENKMIRILIIDDDLEFRLILSELLVGQGYAISTAKNGHAALASLEMMEELPQLILLDSHMPDGNGRDFIKRKTILKKFSHIPVVLISGDLMEVESFKKFGVKSCLTKPLDVLEFVATVEKFVSSP